MSEHIDAVRECRAKAEAVNDSLAATRAEASRLQRQLDELRGKAAEMRDEELARRAVAAGGGDTLTTSSAAEILDVELSAQAAEQARDRTLAKIRDLESAATQATERVNHAEAELLIAEVEAVEMAEVDRLFGQIAEHLSRAIGAARVINDKKHRRGRHIYDLRNRYGPAGEVALALNNLDWPTYPVEFRPSSFQVWNLRNPREFPGTDEAEAAALAMLESIQ